MTVSKKRTFGVALLSLLAAVLLMACAQSPSGSADEDAVLFHSVEPVGSSLPDSASIFKAPETVQELVNRSDVVLIGTVQSVSETKSVLFGSSSDASALVSQGFPEPRIEETHYEIAVEQVLLDDGVAGSLKGNPSIALSGTHTTLSPQVGERIMFALLSRPGDDLYSLVANWSLIPLDGDSIRNFDGTDPGYDGVTDEASLKAAVTTAAGSYVKAEPAKWPTVFD